MNNYLNIKANKKHLMAKNKTKDNQLPIRKLTKNSKDLSLGKKKTKKKNIDKENIDENVLTETGNLSLKLDGNAIKNEKPIKSKICKIKLKKDKIKEIKRVKWAISRGNNSNNITNNNLIKLQKKLTTQNQPKKNISSIPIIKKYVQKTFSTINTNKIIPNKTKVLLSQRTYSIYEVNKTETNSQFNHDNRNSNILNTYYTTENNYNVKEKNNSADVSPLKILKLKNIMKNNKNIVLEEKLDNKTNNSMIVDYFRKRRGTIRIVGNNYNKKYEDKEMYQLSLSYSNDKEDLPFNKIKIMVNKNPQVVEEYFDDIYDYLKLIENSDLPKKNYMKNTQKYISEKMRTILLDWLIDVHARFKLFDETLFLTINIIDRYLSKKSINKKYFQLLGITAMFIASKYEDIYPPDLKEFIFMTDNAYTREELMKLECDILDIIEFNMTYPTSLRFLEIFKKRLHLKDLDFNRCRYFIEICLFDYNCCHFSPSLIAATSIMLNHKINKAKNKDCNFLEEKIFKNHIGYYIKEIYPCLYYLVNMLKQINDPNYKYTSLKRKFGKEEFMKVSTEKYDINNVMEIIKKNK